LIIRAEANASAAWDHTASVLTLLFNVNRGSKTKAAKIEDFHPFRKKAAPAMTVEQLHSLRPVFEAMK
jgi:hypothetical protein